MLPPPEHQRCPRPHPRPSERDLIWNEVKISRQSLPGLGWAPHPVSSVFSREESGSDLWVGKIPWRRKRTPCQCSWLENPMDRGALRANVPGVTKSRAGEATKTSNKADTRQGQLGPPKAGRGGRREGPSPGASGGSPVLPTPRCPTPLRREETLQCKRPVWGAPLGTPGRRKAWEHSGQGAHLEGHTGRRLLRPGLATGLLPSLLRGRWEESGLNPVGSPALLRSVICAALRGTSSSRIEAPALWGWAGVRVGGC